MSSNFLVLTTPSFYSITLLSLSLSFPCLPFQDSDVKVDIDRSALDELIAAEKKKIIDEVALGASSNDPSE